jgi:predicted dienelactone hydrolase
MMKIAIMLTTIISLPAAGSTTNAASTICNVQWTDAARERNVPVRIRMPSGDSPVPLVLFSHGLGGTLEAGTAWGKAWADVGIATIHLQHAGSDDTIWKPAQGREARIQALKDGANAAQLTARVADVKFVLDELMRRRGEIMNGGCRLARFDMSKIGMAGHSFGAVTTQAIAGQRFANERSVADLRIRAAIAFSPSPSAQLPDVESFGKIELPFMSITGTADTTPMLARTTAEDRKRPYAAMPSGNKFLLVFEGADHSIFNGHGQRRVRQANDEHVAKMVTMATSLFWKSYLLDDAVARKSLTATDGLSNLLNDGDTLANK